MVLKKLKLKYNLKTMNFSKILVVAMTCGRNYSFAIPMGDIKLVNIHCDPELNGLDANEAGPMLRFLIQIYDHPMADKYIFIHGHETSNHYPKSISKTIKELTKTDHFKKNDFGGLFPSHKQKLYGHFNPFKDTISIRIGHVKLHDYIFEILPSYFEQFENYSQWNFPCCSSFFISHSLIRKTPLATYTTILKNLHIFSSKHICDSFNGKTCQQVGKGRRPCSTHIAGNVMEYCWALLFTNLSSVN